MAVIRTFVARPGSHIRDGDAQVIGTFLEQTFNGKVFTVEEFIEEARPEEAPVHTYLTWDRDKAAGLWIRHEARNLIDAVMVVEESNANPSISRAFHHVVELTETGTVSGYVVEHVVWQREDFAEQVIERAKREFMNWRKRYSQYEGLRQWALEQLEEED
jgi:hypothetical protein